MFAEKLDFLIVLTQVTNASLARAAHVDPSLVSRLRRGKRGLPANQNCLPHMAAFFARNLSEPWQIEILQPVLQTEDLSELPKDVLATQLHDWLLDENAATDLPDSADIQSQALQNKEKPTSPSHRPVHQPDEKPSYYFGTSGKQQAVVRFLNDLLADPIPKTMYMYSDEEMTWMRQDADFAAYWNGLFLQCFQKGHRAVIIHDIERGIREMLEGVGYWLPLYGSGKLQSYFFPQLRDPFMRTTMFVAPGCAAVISSSILEKETGMVNYYVTDPEAINAELQRFLNYLDLCVPLLEHLDRTNPTQFWAGLAAILENPTARSYLNQTPSLWTMPTELAGKIATRSENGLFASQAERLQKIFTANLSDNDYQEILPTELLLNPGAVDVPLPLADWFGLAGATYQPNELAAHLAHLAELQEQHPRFTVVPIPMTATTPSIIWCVNRLVLSKPDQAKSAVQLTHDRLISAFEMYSSRQIDLQKSHYGRDQVTKLLRQAADKLLTRPQ